jgi:hypothetical protein
MHDKRQVTREEGENVCKIYQIEVFLYEISFERMQRQ